MRARPAPWPRAPAPPFRPWPAAGMAPPPRRNGMATPTEPVVLPAKASGERSPRSAAGRVGRSSGSSGTGTRPRCTGGGRRDASASLAAVRPAPVARTWPWVSSPEHHRGVRPCRKSLAPRQEGRRPPSIASRAAALGAGSRARPGGACTARLADAAGDPAGASAPGGASDIAARGRSGRPPTARDGSARRSRRNGWRRAWRLPCRLGAIRLGSLGIERAVPAASGRTPLARHCAGGRGRRFAAFGQNAGSETPERMRASEGRSAAFGQNTLSLPRAGCRVR